MPTRTNHRIHYVIAYDIPDDARRLRVAKLLDGYGHRVQFSVFEARLSRDNLERLRSRLKRIISPTEDRVTIYYLCENCWQRKTCIGKKVDTDIDIDVIII
ncbi:MAG: CRISPR-associated endonuclease Cas2 [Candidatus Sumerlaeia bacterium]|nr:CRISPR-associated endonuclease Cas2 [Candidatus Sumerlaeia bacterium]